MEEDTYQCKIDKRIASRNDAANRLNKILR